MKIEIQKIEKSRIDSVDFDKIPFGRVFSDHIFVMEYRDNKWHTPIIKPYAPFQLSPASAVLHYSQAIFEGLKAYRYLDNKVSIFRPEDNIRRMNRSAERICMPKVDVSTILNGIQALVDIDRQWIPEEEGSSLYIRPFMFSNDEYIGVRPSENYFFAIFTCPVGAYYGKPISVKIETDYIRAAKGGTGDVKFGGNYAGSLMPAKLALNQGFDQLIWTDAQTHQYIEEAGTMNIMLVKNNTLVTPPISGTILDGITRNSILGIAQQMGIKIEERAVKVSEVVEGLKDKSITELFGVGTAATIIPINGLGYKDKRIDIPLLPKGISTVLYDRLEGIKRGKYVDDFQWLTRI